MILTFPGHRFIMGRLVGSVNRVRKKSVRRAAAVCIAGLFIDPFLNVPLSRPYRACVIPDLLPGALPRDWSLDISSSGAGGEIRAAETVSGLAVIVVVREAKPIGCRCRRRGRDEFQA